MGTLGYGTDLRGSSDLTESMDEYSDPNDPMILVEALARRFDCPEGGLLDDPLYGFDLRELIGTGVTEAELDSMAGRIRGQAELDDRVGSARVTVTPGGLPIGSELTISIRVVPIDPQTGVFTLTLLVTSAEVIMKELLAA